MLIKYLREHHMDCNILEDIAIPGRILVYGGFRSNGKATTLAQIYPSNIAGTIFLKRTQSQDEVLIRKYKDAAAGCWLSIGMTRVVYLNDPNSLNELSNILRNW